jgi:hypothetical protein
MGKAQEPGGDYGYDLAHEDVQRTARRSPSGGEERPPERPEDTVGDYGYDEAHDF